MTKRQVLLQLRAGTEDELRDLTSADQQNFDQLSNDWSDRDALLLASRPMKLSGVVTPLDLGLVKYGLHKLCH